MTNLTPQIVKDLWAFLSAKYGSTVKAKAEATEMQLIAEGLSLIGVLDKTAFLTRFTTTIGKTIYAPFAVGVVSDQHSLLSQVIVAAHEHQHIVQSNADMTFAPSYLLDSSWRAVYEAEAYRVSLTMAYHLTGVLGTPKDYASYLNSYGVGARDIKFAEEYLRLSLPTIRAGGVPDEAARVAIQWLREHAPQVLVSPSNNI